MTLRSGWKTDLQHGLNPVGTRGTRRRLEYQALCLQGSATFSFRHCCGSSEGPSWSCIFNSQVEDQNHPIMIFTLSYCSESFKENFSLASGFFSNQTEKAMKEMWILHEKPMVRHWTSSSRQNQPSTIHLGNVSGLSRPETGGFSVCEQKVAPGERSLVAASGMTFTP